MTNEQINEIMERLIPKMINKVENSNRLSQLEKDLILDGIHDKFADIVERYKSGETISPEEAQQAIYDTLNSLVERCKLSSL